MIGLEDIYKVVVAMVPLYVALMLGYASVKWWHIFNREQCEALDRLVCYFTLPLFTFEFTSHADPFKMNYRFIAADLVSKLIIVIILVLWAKLSSKGRYDWAITNFSLCSITNSLVIGVPLLRAMYGELGVDLVVQITVVQFIIWFPIILFVMELRQAKINTSSVGNEQNDLEANANVRAGDDQSFLKLLKVVCLKVVVNPNVYACVFGLAWAFLSNRCHFTMPTVIKESVLIMSRAGLGTVLFSMGIFMALQERLVACGAKLAILGMILRFIVGPGAFTIAAIAIGLHGQVLRIAILQAALPQAVTSFIYAKQYGLHAEVFSTAVVFGMVLCPFVAVAYYAILELVH